MPSGAQGVAHLLRKFQKNWGSNPLVGVVGSGVHHQPLSPAQNQGIDGTAVDGKAQPLPAEKGKLPDQLCQSGGAPGGIHGDICIHNGHKKSPPTILWEAVKSVIQLTVYS